MKIAASAGVSVTARIAENPIEYVFYAPMTQATIEDVPHRFAEHITTVECHFADENHAGDIRCSLEVRFEGKKPIGCTQHAADLPVALESAAETMARMLDHQLGRIRDSLGAPSRTA